MIGANLASRWLVILLALIRLASAEPLHLRIVAGNLSSGRYQNYDSGEGARIFQGLRPDIALIQEFRSGDNGVPAIDSWVRSVFGPAAKYYRQDKELPNGIVSHFPIIDSGFWTDNEMPNRDFAWARIELPNKQRILVVSLHLSASKEAKRRAETEAVANYCKESLQPGEWLVIGGDFNTQTRNESCVKTLAPLVETGLPHPADESGNDNTNAKRNKPTDWLLVSAPLHALEIPNRLTEKRGLVFDSRVFSDLTKVPPVLATDSAAEQMQHMAVLRDFLIPDPETQK